MKTLKKLLLILLALILIPTTIVARDKPHKEEVLYNKMNFDGSVDAIFVVNSFSIEEKTSFVDYGDYKRVVNTTTADKLEVKNKRVHLDNLEKGRFFYQGVLNEKTDLPWDIKLRYFLDNKEIDAQDLGGASGDLEIKIDVKQNKNVNPVYFENYLLTMTFSIDSNRIEKLKAPDATIGNNGDKKTIVFTSLPKTETSVSIKAQVNDFEMDPIQIAGLPFTMDFELPDLTTMTSGLTDLQLGIKALNEGTKQLAGGIDQLDSETQALVDGACALATGARSLLEGARLSAEGSEDYVSGIRQYTSGVNQLSEGSKELVDGSVQIKEGIHTLSTYLLMAKDFLTLTDEQQAIIDQTIVVLKQFKELLLEDFTTVLLQGIADGLKKEAILEMFPDLDLENENILLLLDYLDAQSTEVENAIPIIQPYIDQINEQLVPHLDQVILILESLPQITEMIDGVAELDNQYQLFHDGLVELSDGLSALDEGSSSLVSGGEAFSVGLYEFKDGLDLYEQGVQAYADGISQAKSGISQLNDGAKQLSAGTSTLESETSNIDELMEEKINELMADYEFGDFDVISFVDDNNDNVELVQFVYLTQPISKAKQIETQTQEVAKKSIWDLILDLFK